MAQDVTVAGAAYSDVPAVALPATGGGTAEFYDVSATTATAEDVASGKTFYSASGALTTGTASGGGDGVGVFYGTCSTAAATAAKAVVCEEFTSDHLIEGTVINVKFANAQTYNGAPTLNVQSTGAKNIKRIGSTNAARYEWQAGEVLQFVYDGSYWVLTDAGIATTTYYGVTKLSSATNSTSNALAATASAVKAAYDHASSKQDALVSGANIKTINGESLLGSGNLTVSELPAVTEADNGKVLMVVGGRWTMSSLPIATDSQYGVVMVDGTTITATGGVISTAGGSTASEVTVTLTNPHNTSEFRRVEVKESDTPTGSTTTLLGKITSPTGSGTYTVEKPYMVVAPYGIGSPWIYESNCTCTGGVAFDSAQEGWGVFLVTGDGTVTISGLDYDG